MNNTATNLMSMDRTSMEAFFSDMGEKPFRAKQLLQWIYQRRVTDFSQMTDFSKDLRARLAADTSLVLPEIASEQRSADGTVKWLLRLHDGNCIETVFIPESDRGTLCVSSQVGCGLNCTFCSTARQGFNRNLSVDEIISQVWIANSSLETSGSWRQYVDERPEHDKRRPVTNVVMMGMGEPLMNFENVVPAMNLMMDDFSFGLSRRRVTLSTAGMVPQIDRLKDNSPVSLAVSLHAPENELRNKLVPLNRKYPIEELMAACRRYVEPDSRQRITFEYVMLNGVNDSLDHAKQLAELLRGFPAKVNLIPFNTFPDSGFECSSANAINRFRDYLLGENVFTVTRKTRGDDIDAACGQLAGDFQDRTRRSARMQGLKVVLN